MEKIRVGVLGMGSMGSQYARMLWQGEIPRMELAAVTRIGKKAEEWAKRELPEDFPVFQNGEELLEYSPLDAVIIATPHYSHEQYTLTAMKRGLHVMCEKPEGVYTLQAERMNREAAERSLVFAIMFQQRTLPVYRKIREIVKSGRYGALKRVNWILTDWYRTESYYKETAWRGTWAGEGGGVLLNQCPHNLDLLQWICGMPNRVQAFCHEGKWHQIEVEDEVTAYMEFPNGATGIFLASTGDPFGVNRLQIDLEQGMLLYEQGKLIMRNSKNEKVHCLMDANLEEGKDPFGPYRVMLENFADAILYKDPLIASGQEGIYSLTLSNAMYLSSWKKEIIQIPFSGEEFWEELQKKRKNTDN